MISGTLCGALSVRFCLDEESGRDVMKSGRDVLVSVVYPTVTMRKCYERKVVVSSRGGYLVTSVFLLVASTLLCDCFPCLFVSKTICSQHF